MTDTSSGQIIPADASQVVDVDKLPKDALKAIIAKLNERSQSVTQIFKDEYRIKVSDLRQLIAQLKDEFSACTIISLRANATVLLSNNQRFDFGSFEEFEEFDSSQPEKTKSLSFEMTIDVLRGEDRIPERYTAQISIQNNPPAFGIQIGPLGIRPIDSFEAPPAPIAATVRFNNYIIGKNLIGTIENWEKSLTKVTREKTRWLQKKSSSISQAISVAGTFAGIYACRAFLGIIDDASPTTIGQFFIISAGVVFAFHTLSEYLGRSVERNIDRLSGKSNISITRGDENRDVKIDKKNKVSIIKAISFSAGVVLQIVCSISASYIFLFLTS